MATVKKQRYSGIKSRAYEDRPLKYRHISTPWVTAVDPLTGRLKLVLAPKGQGVTYRRPVAV